MQNFTLYVGAAALYVKPWCKKGWQVTIILTKNCSHFILMSSYMTRYLLKYYTVH